MVHADFCGFLRIFAYFVLSVLALSSRFDGQRRHKVQPKWQRLSVLALSSRFDGLAAKGAVGVAKLFFQYSLCRVVLMVPVTTGGSDSKVGTFSTRSVESF